MCINSNVNGLSRRYFKRYEQLETFTGMNLISYEDYFGGIETHLFKCELFSFFAVYASITYTPRGIQKIKQMEYLSAHIMPILILNENPLFFRESFEMNPSATLYCGSGNIKYADKIIDTGLSISKDINNHVRVSIRSDIDTSSQCTLTAVLIYMYPGNDAPF